jgi:hypothetical protein
MTPYAHRTDVPVERSRAELDALLSRYGATSRIIGDDRRTAIVAFSLGDHLCRVSVPIPSHADTGPIPRHWEYMNDRDQRAVLARNERARWRSLVLLVKAKLEAIRLGVTTAAREFPALSGCTELARTGT